MNKNANLFNSIQLQRPKSNSFDLSHDVKLSCKMGQLVPTLVMECVPGDMFQIGCNSLLRFAPMLAPVMHRIDVTMHYFFVPNRILWDGWEDFIINGGYTSDPPTFPYVTIKQGNTNAASYNWTKLADYMGIPSGAAEQVENVSALPFAAYQAIYEEYYRDENLINPFDWTLVNGDNTASFVRDGFAGPAGDLGTLHNRAWEHDYFTASLPFAQKGQPVTIPLGQFTDVDVVGSVGIGAPNTTLTGAPDNKTVVNEYDPAFPNAGLRAKTSQLEEQANSINDLRRAFRLQEWLEKNARGGTRYIENILVHFGVRSSDKRLQRPEYITGTKSPVVISEVLNTTGTTDLPQGNMSGHGAAVTSGGYGKYFCEEHGFIIGIMSVMPKPSYQQGLARFWLKVEDPFQYYWPSFEHIGEQEVFNKEIFAFQGSTGADTFGYVPRYAEYKYQPPRVAGDFRSTLDFWTCTRIFGTPPALNQEFIECTDDQVNRIFAVQDGTDNLWCQVLHTIRSVRRMGKYGTPSFY